MREESRAQRTATLVWGLLPGLTRSSYHWSLQVILGQSVLTYIHLASLQVMLGEVTKRLSPFLRCTYTFLLHLLAQLLRGLGESRTRVHPSLLARRHREGSRSSAGGSRIAEGSLAARDCVQSARVVGKSHTHGARKGLEARLDDVMAVDAGALIDMQSHLGAAGDACVELTDELCVVCSNTLRGDVEAVFKVVATGEVENNLDERLVERGDKVAESGDTTLVAHSLRNGHAEGDSDILVGVMIVDPQVSDCLDVEVDEPVGRQLVEHVIKERDAGVDVANASTVEVERHSHRGFVCVSRD
jgi:hypothetical protein